MTILHRREAGLQAVPPENGLSEVPAGCQVIRDLLQVRVRSLGFSVTAAQKVVVWKTESLLLCTK